MTCARLSFNKNEPLYDKQQRQLLTNPLQVGFTIASSHFHPSKMGAPEKTYPPDKDRIQAMDWILNMLVVLTTAALMEPFAWVMHRFVMHGFGWGWHASHHRPDRKKSALFERNDLYAVVFALFAIVLIALGTHVSTFDPLRWIGYGMTLYGLVYFVVHDGMVHQRWPFTWIPRHGYLKTLYQAHLLHHASTNKDNAVSLGFLYASSPRVLKQQTQNNRFNDNQ